MAGVNVVIFGGLHDGFHALAQPDNLPNKNAQIARHHLVENIVLGSTLAPISCAMASRPLGIFGFLMPARLSPMALFLFVSTAL